MVPKNIAIEGMPGAGKTSALLKLIGQLPAEFILLSETNPEPNSDWLNGNLHDQTDVYHQMWIDRMNAVSKATENHDVTFIFDRSYFSNLAFKYALDALLDTHDFDEYLHLFKKDLLHQEFALIIVLDIDPEIGCKRREGLKEIIPFPWNKKIFMKAFRVFYREILPKITSRPIILINTDDMSPCETQNHLNKIFQFFRKNNTPRIACIDNDIAKATLLKFAQNNQLGVDHSEIVDVFGHQTLYFQRHSIQIDNGSPIFFNNQRLNDLIKKLTVR